ncbi:hypothetical protein [Legionella oakridgensis]|uniref:Uncharacterized protein n=2 Tax=Legionella oakridgensis TaxID=29423 RepID=W0BBA4_9GAMM|nr:hypothetical protein [Legionella oakridgensis]AHE67145.1 hypothetical protein Loa_01597 [Legionella oakridgensis ATCC 33761 = DSM 21215]KTD38048.1 hypothetical protein Loak_1724 [Legionella oakridgensis]STY20230.1 Uncharacterised protein [Legionella longbeachae]
MAFFLGKSPLEIKNALNESSLEQLELLKTQYNLTLTKLSRRQQLTETSLQQCTAQLLDKESQLTSLKAREQEIIEQEEARKQALADSLEDRSVDNYLIRISLLSYSPMAAYHDEMQRISASIHQLNEQANKTRIHLATLAKLIRTEEQELNILNPILQRKILGAEMKLTSQPVIS